jgi:hypothetical protein
MCSGRESQNNFPLSGSYRKSLQSKDGSIIGFVIRRDLHEALDRGRDVASIAAPNCLTSQAQRQAIFCF